MKDRAGRSTEARRGETEEKRGREGGQQGKGGGHRARCSSGLSWSLATSSSPQSGGLLYSKALASSPASHAPLPQPPSKGPPPLPSSVSL